MTDKGGRPPEEDDSFYFRMDSLLAEDPSRNKAAAVRKAAGEFGIKVTQQLLWRATRRYRKLKKEGRFSSAKPLPGPVRTRLEAVFRKRAEAVADANADLQQAEHDAAEVGLELPEELDELSHRLRREIDSLRELVSPTGHEVQIHDLTYGARDLDEAEQRYREAEARHARALIESGIVERAREARRILRALSSSQ